MLLNQTAVYGLRAMASLAMLAPGERINAAELSERTRVPQQYLSKVMRKLVVAKLVNGRKGHGGGFCLARAPKEIPLRDVLSAVDIDMHSGCAFGYAACDLENPCSLHPLWSRLNQCLDSWANGCTLAEIGPPPKPGRRR